MTKAYRACVGIVTALALCKYSMAEWNATDAPANRTVSSCRHHGNSDNCTDTGQWGGHFSPCPRELRYYCVHGTCRYIEEQKAPSCRCDSGFVGSRCEYVDLDWQIGDQRQIIIACVIAGLVFLILLIVFICMCTRCRPRKTRTRREEPSNGSEKIHMMDTNATHTASTTDLTRRQQTDV